jgi:hypothetical protein
MKDNEMGREYSTHGIDEKFIQKLVGDPKGKRPLAGLMYA